MKTNLHPPTPEEIEAVTEAILTSMQENDGMAYIKDLHNDGEYNIEGYFEMKIVAQAAIEAFIKKRGENV